jgi:hypothetical protein
VKLLLIALLCASARGEECEGFDFAVERDGTRVYNRKIEGSSVRELCATTRVDATPAEVYAFLRDIESYPSRLPPTVVAQRMDASTFYMVIDPGFITRRDYCVTVDGGQNGDRYWTSWHQVNCPLRQHLERMVTNRGSWKVTPIDGGKASAIVYLTHADPGGLVPAWIVNSATARRLPEIMNALKRALNLEKVSRR